MGGVTVCHRSSKSPGAHSEEPVCASLNKDDAVSPWSSTEFAPISGVILLTAEICQGSPRKYNPPVATHTLLFKAATRRRLFLSGGKFRMECCKKQPECVLTWWTAQDINRGGGGLDSYCQVALSWWLVGLRFPIVRQVWGHEKHTEFLWKCYIAVL